MEKNIKIELMKSVDSIKSKIKQMKNLEHEANLSLDKIFKPVSEPLNSLVKSRVLKNVKNSVSGNSMTIDSDENSCDDFHDAVISSASTPKKEEKNDAEASLESEDIYGIYDGLNVPFGIRTENKTLMIGNEVVSFSKIGSLDNDNTFLVKIGDKTYNFTPGLKELLLRRKPELKLITNMDKLDYKDILNHTNAHKRDYNPNGQIRGDKGTKYRQIIKPLYNETSIEKASTKLGGNLPKLKNYKTSTELIYWDDPNELVERLKLIVASRDAGNTNHDNEILSVIEELKEANIIKE